MNIVQRITEHTKNTERSEKLGQKYELGKKESIKSKYRHKKKMDQNVRTNEYNNIKTKAKVNKSKTQTKLNTGAPFSQMAN